MAYTATCIESYNETVAKRNRWQRWNRQIRAVVRRDGSFCWLCGEEVLPDLRVDDPRSPSVDHVVERRNGGWNDLDNLRLAHRSCNSSREYLFPATSHDPLDESAATGA